MDSSRAFGDAAYRRRRYGFHFSSHVFPTPVSSFLDLLGLLRASSQASDHEAAISSVGLDRIRVSTAGPDRIRVSSSGTVLDDDAELSIRIIGSEEINSSSSSTIPPLIATPDDNASRSSSVSSDMRNGFIGNESQHRYDFHQITRWIEQVLPFSILLLTVFIKQHLQGFLVILWLSVVLFKANDILRKQTALKGDRSILVITAVVIWLLSQTTAFYWWHGCEDLLRPLIMLPPRKIPKFWHAVFVIMANDMSVRQGAMVLKCGILVYYKNTRGRSYCRQGQLLTFVEYLLFLYRSLLPTAVWYRFFLNKDYGSFFSSLTTGLYLTFKVACVLKKVRMFISAFKALSRREAQYGAYATAEEVNTAGDICAICQEKMHAPILLSCKHIFCEDCVSEWFQRERTCPLCRAIVKSAILRSFGDGSTSLLYQIF